MGIKLGSFSEIDGNVPPNEATITIANRIIAGNNNKANKYHFKLIRHFVNPFNNVANPVLPSDR